MSTWAPRRGAWPGTIRLSASGGRTPMSGSSPNGIRRGPTMCRREQASLFQPLSRTPDDRIGDPRAIGDVEEARVAVTEVEHPQHRLLVVRRGDRAAGRPEQSATAELRLAVR